VFAKVCGRGKAGIKMFLLHCRAGPTRRWLKPAMGVLDWVPCPTASPGISQKRNPRSPLNLTWRDDRRGDTTIFTANSHLQWTLATQLFLSQHPPHFLSLSYILLGAIYSFFFNLKFSPQYNPRSSKLVCRLVHNTRTLP